MLRIVKDVDLKDLEKFGFKYRGSVDFLYKSKYKEWSVILIEIDPKSRILKLSSVPDLFNTIEDTLYDLITAGLVEKIKDN